MVDRTSRVYQDERNARLKVMKRAIEKHLAIMQTNDPSYHLSEDDLLLWQYGFDLDYFEPALESTRPDIVAVKKNDKRWAFCWVHTDAALDLIKEVQQNRDPLR